MVSVLQFASERVEQSKTLERRPSRDAPPIYSAQKSIANLEAMGVRVFGVEQPPGLLSKNEVLWDNIAGYDQQKRYVKSGIDSISSLCFGHLPSLMGASLKFYNYKVSLILMHIAMMHGTFFYINIFSQNFSRLASFFSPQIAA